MMNTTICQAIRDMKVLTFTYADRQGNIHDRTVEPYAHGVTKAGNEAVRAYQTAGTSESKIPNWRLFVVNRITNLSISEQRFDGTAPDYAHGDEDLDPIHCLVP